MSFEIQAPDGSIIEFPDGTTEEQINAAMQQAYAPTAAAPPQGQPQGQPQAFYDNGRGISIEVGAAANPPPAEEAPPSPWARALDYGQTALNLGLTALNPMASHLLPRDERAEAFKAGGRSGALLGGKNELTAAISSLGALGNGYGAQFVENLNSLDAQDAGLRTAHPGAWNAGAVSGGLASGAVAPFVAPQLASGSLGSRALANAVLGGASGALATDGDLGDRAGGAAFGAALGGGAPFAGAAIGAGTRAGLNRLQAPVQGLPREMGRILAEAGAPGTAERLAQLGPEAMLLDASPGLTGLAQGVGTKPIPARTALANALTERRTGTSGRLATDLDTAYGPAPVVSEVESGFQQQRRALGPQYEASLAGAAPVDLSAAAGVLNQHAANAKGGIAGALRKVRGMIETRVPGTDLRSLESNPEAVLGVRQAIDDMLATTGGNEARILGQVRQSVDEALAASAPGIKDVDAQFATLMRQSDALEQGRTLLDSGRTTLHPNELAAAIEGATENVNTARTQGARAEIDRLVGTTANDRVALARAIKGEGDWNRAKLSQLFGEEPTARVIGAADREAAFESAYQAIVGGSNTAQKQGGAKALEAGTDQLPIEGNTTWLGLGLGTAKKVARSALGRRNQEMSDRLAEDLTPLLMSTGPERDALVRAIAEAPRRRLDRTEAGEAARRIADVLLQGSGRGAVGSTTGGSAPP